MIKSKLMTRVSGRIGLPARIARIVAVLLAVLAGLAQSASAPRMEFETATVKVHPLAPGTYLIKSYTHGPPFVIPGGNRFTETAHAQDLVMEAYGVNEYQILYLPEWTRARGGLVYDVEAKAPGGATPTPGQFQQMLQALLADQFHLKTHWETKPKFSVYALVVDKNGPKFHEFHGDDVAADSAKSGT